MTLPKKSRLFAIKRKTELKSFPKTFLKINTNLLEHFLSVPILSDVP